MRFEIISSSEHLRPFRWRLVTGEGGIVAAGPPTADVASVREAIRLVKDAADGAEVRDLTAGDGPARAV